MGDFLPASRRTILGSMLAGGTMAAVPTVAQASQGRGQGNGPNRRPRGQETMIGVPFDQVDTVRIGLIGLGQRGMAMLSGWASVPGSQVVAVCDIRADRATRAADRLVDLGRDRPEEFGGDEGSFQEMLDSTELDFVYIATPWEDHHEQALATLHAGAHAGVDLPIATELDHIWDLVNASEQTRKHLFLMENISYGRNELVMLKMAQEGLFGDVTNGHGGYLHDLRDLLFSDTYYADQWRRKWHTTSIASLYAMHGLAPIAAAMDINRGDRMTTLQATATAPKGLADYRERFISRDHPSWQEEYINGDLVTCLIETDRGRIIRAEHDVSSPRPYSRINSLAGTRGIMEDFNARIYLEPDHDGHQWAEFAPYRDKYDHWLWKKIGDDALADGGHGGADYILQWRIVQQMRAGLVPDIDVYDSAVWCAPVPLSVQSLENGGAPVDFPDFTRGDWSTPRMGLNSEETDMPPVD